MTAPAAGMYYMSAVQSGMSSLQLMAGGDTAETRAAYDNAYANEAQRYASQDALAAAQKNISVVKQNVILSNVEIDKQQAQAEAAIKVQAAAAGAEGSSVQGTIQQTNVNAAFASSAVEAKGDAQTEQYLAQAHAASMQLSSIQDQDVDYFDNLMNSQLSSVNSQDLLNVGTWWDDGAGGLKDWFSGTSKKSGPSEWERNNVTEHMGG